MADHNSGTNKAERPPSLESGQLLESIRSELRKSGGELQKFLSLAESLREIVPDERKRYAAAFKALHESSGTTRGDILAAVESQLSALKGQKERLMESFAAKGEERKALLAKHDGIKSRMSALRETLKKLEEEEKAVLSLIAAGEEETRKAEKAVGSITGSIEKELHEAREKVSAFLAEGKDSAAETESASPGDAFLNEESPEETPEAESPLISPVSDTPPADTPPAVATEAGGKPCPSCRNRMDWYEVDRKWKCFVCGHEED